MANKRMNQLTFMFSEITGVSPNIAASIIQQTETGKAVINNNTAVLYEQQTENLYSIAMELKENPCYKKYAHMLSEDQIIRSMKKLYNIERSNREKNVLTLSAFASHPEKKAEERQKLLLKRKEILTIKKQNQKNAWRVEHADKCT